MDNSYDLTKIYGIPPAKYSEDDPNDLFLSNLPSLEQIAFYNLSKQQGSSVHTNMPDGMSTPTTSLLTDNSQSGYTNPNMMQSASSEVPFLMNTTNGQGTTLTQQITDYSNPFPVTSDSIQYLNGFIRTQIGRRAQIQFLMGNSDLVTKDGYLLGVGSNYILINEIGTNDITACDFYNIKFIRFLY